MRKSAFRAYVSIPATKLAKKAAPSLATRRGRPREAPAGLDEFLDSVPEVQTSDFRLVDAVGREAMEIVAVATMP